ncbi:hypothetical protein OAK75_08895 [Bacteriovoracales bacterium]|nr:hypothetical protein [Bacteriovoracales bacterium]
MKITYKHLILLFFFSTNLTQAANYKGSSFSEVWNIVSSDPYNFLPEKEVTFSSLYSGFTNLIEKSAKRTVSNKNDILPHFNKLLHKNGTCMSGQWIITKENPYSGHFKKGTKALMIGRASTTLSNTKQGDLRGFGLAGKIYPTLDTEENHETANFFLIDNLGGTYEDNFTRADLSNEPGILPSFSFSLPFLAPVAAAVSRAFAKADKNPGIRQVYSISNLGLLENEKAKTPKYMKFVGSSEEFSVSEMDFRDELAQHISTHGKVTFDIFVANTKDYSGEKEWNKIGKARFDKIIASKGCDHRLHFHHHKFKP